MIDVLIMEASTQVRTELKALIESDGSMRVVGQAKDAAEARALMQSLRPGIVAMDIHLPGMIDFDIISSIMAEIPCPIVGLSGVFDQSDLKIRQEAEAAGALIVLDKPEASGMDARSSARFLRSLRGMSEVRVIRRTRSKRPVPPVVVSTRKVASPQYIDLLAIGASTGGPPAIQTLLLGLPPLPIPVVIVQHISEGFILGLARWLDDTTPHTVKVAENGETLRHGIVYLAPDDNHLVLRNKTTLALLPEPPVGGHRPSVNVLFESVASMMGRSAGALLLTGMGRDGAEGLLSIRQKGGHTLAQDEESCIVFGMPGEAVAIGAAEIVSPLGEIAHHVLQWLPRSPTSNPV